ncbi:amidohydrolase family protein [Mangrovicoccus ximenensis]|uniref:amidohydrolase family protein n=1 Tax=Mangrovicoccus ximenensis TaxID=1911570 RepID=UPI000D3549A8|nr:amidohydrolase family protein [Mangrovicoccus ximenensis]
MSEPILEPDLPIIDAHHHLFDRHGTRYMIDEFLADMRAGHNVVASVYVEASAFLRREGPEILRPLGEVEFANGVGAMCAGTDFEGPRACAAIVGKADLRAGAAVGELLDRQISAAPDRFRGIRQIVMDHPSDVPFRYFFTGRPPQGIYGDPAFREGFRELAARGLTYDATGFHLQLPQIAALADDFPDTPVIVNHMTVAMGLEMTAEERAALFAEWKAGLAEVAKRPNAVCKIGGLGMPIWGFGFDTRETKPGSKELAAAWRPFVETAIELFGPERAMMESNFPPDARSCGYVELWNALKRITSGCSAEEKAALYSGTAARVYRIALP